MPTMHMPCAFCSCARLTLYVRVGKGRQQHMSQYIHSCLCYTIMQIKARAGYVLYRALVIMVNMLYAIPDYIYSFNLFIIGPIDIGQSQTNARAIAAGVLVPVIVLSIIIIIVSIICVQVKPYYCSVKEF